MIRNHVHKLSWKHSCVIIICACDECTGTGIRCVPLLQTADSSGAILLHLTSLRPVAFTLDSTIFNEIGHHDNRSDLFLPDHFPEFINRVWQRALEREEKSRNLSFIC